MLILLSKQTAARQTGVLLAIGVTPAASAKKEDSNLKKNTLRSRTAVSNIRIQQRVKLSGALTQHDGTEELEVSSQAFDYHSSGSSLIACSFSQQSADSDGLLFCEMERKPYAHPTPSRLSSLGTALYQWKFLAPFTMCGLEVDFRPKIHHRYFATETQKSKKFLNRILTELWKSMVKEQRKRPPQYQTEISDNTNDADCLT
ncbi:hypothetical protein CDAR_438631 [Caerostris darwini]|uniref:Uncharacterized protein n=1 Tax=Caerostris darwini TaxID=1538125 RepID=A0AAV4X2K6_9ARAC|nr:hypothetical protein CDAR_438631 [Caerostris darwini]